MPGAFLGGKLVWPVLLESRSRFRGAQPAMLIRRQPRKEFADVQAVRSTRI
jgi:hypothetical protein